MRAYENVMFSIHCDDIFFKMGLVDILDAARGEIVKNGSHQRPALKSGKNDYNWIDIVALSSKSILEKLPQKGRLFDGENTGVIVFCTDRMMNVIKGLDGYEQAIFISADADVEEIKRVFTQALINGSESRKGMLREKGLDRLNDREEWVTKLFKEEMTQQEISELTKMSVKLVSHHLRSAMTKYQVNNLLEYCVKHNYVTGAGAYAV